VKFRKSFRKTCVDTLIESDFDSHYRLIERICQVLFADILRSASPNRHPDERVNNPR
jgi:hypothetical protein